MDQRAKLQISKAIEMICDNCDELWERGETVRGDCRRPFKLKSAFGGVIGRINDSL